MLFRHERVRPRLWTACFHGCKSTLLNQRRKQKQSTVCMLLSISRLHLHFRLESMGLLGSLAAWAGALLWAAGLLHASTPGRQAQKTNAWEAASQSGSSTFYSFDPTVYFLFTNFRHRLLCQTTRLQVCLVRHGGCLLRGPGHDAARSMLRDFGCYLV